MGEKLVKPKKTKRVNITRSLFIGVISVATVIGMASVGFASWSFPTTYKSVTVKGDADGVSITQIETALGNFGVFVTSSSATVEHYVYSVYEDVYVVDENGDLVYSDDDTENPLTETQLVEHDTYGDLNIHSDLTVNLGYTSGQYDNINSISYDDDTYTYLKVEVQLQGTLLLVSYKGSSLTLVNLPQYIIEPDYKLTNRTLITYCFYIPVKSLSVTSLYSLAVTDTVNSTSSIPFSLDITFDLSESYEYNSNKVTQIVLTYSIISQATYESDMNGGSTSS